MGGTFMALDESYRDYFIRNLHDALSGHTSSSVEEAVKSVKILLNISVFLYPYMYNALNTIQQFYSKSICGVLCTCVKFILYTYVCMF